MQFSELFGQPRSFTGPGQAKTAGKRLCVIGFEGYDTVEKSISHDQSEPDVILDVSIDSHEFERDDNLMLLSLTAQ